MNAIPPNPRKGDPHDGDDHQPTISSPTGNADLKLPKLVSFDSLTRCGDELWIENHGEIYRLRRTRQGKLILTK